MGRWAAGTSKRWNGFVLILLGCCLLPADGLPCQLFSAPTKFVPLSINTSAGFVNSPTKRRKPYRKSVVESVWTSSRYVYRVTKVMRRPYRFEHYLSLMESYISLLKRLIFTDNSKTSDFNSKRLSSSWNLQCTILCPLKDKIVVLMTKILMAFQIKIKTK